MKYASIKQSDERALPSKRLFRLLEVSGSGYYTWLKRKPTAREIENKQLREWIAKIYWQHQGRYGYRRIYRELLEEYGYRGSHERVRKQMRVSWVRGNS